jgi:hypothetical protein
MNTKITASFEQERFQRWLRNVLRTSKREVSVVCQENFRFVIRDCFKLTPPMADGTFTNGFSRARKAIKKDTTQAFKSLTEKGVAALAKRGLKPPPGGVSAALKWYKRQQGPNKRVHLNDKKRLILKPQLEELRLRLQKDIGITAAGWVKAAKELNVKPAPPEWITRHTSKNSGYYRFSASENTLEIVARNTSKHSASSYIQSILDRAFDGRVKNMIKNVKKALAVGKVDPGAIEWGQRTR